MSAFLQFDHLICRSYCEIRRATMEALKACSFPLFYLNMTSTRQARIQFYRPILHLSPNRQPNSSPHPNHNPKARFKLYTAISTPASTELTGSPEEETEIEKKDEKFDWYSHWYPIMPVCDLDKRRPHGKRVIGLDVVVWWDRNENTWKVFDDSCPHRLAPLSEGRIDQWGRLQCVYHGWCFGGSGDCKLIPQEPRDKPPVHTSKKACVAVYPTCVQNGIVWFWPNSDPQYKDIILTKKPPYIPEMDDPSYTKATITRDIQYGYEVLIENLMDPAHVPYAHYGVLPIPKRKDSVKVDREGGRPLDINIKKLDINGFIAQQDAGENFFIPPCLFYGYFNVSARPSDGPASSTRTTERPSTKVQPKRNLLVFLCVPVSPGNSRLIFASPRNFAVWVDRIFPRWLFHLGQNLILDSDLYLLHVEERKLKEIGPTNWQKACYVPTKSDALVVSFRRWLNKYSSGQFDWGTKFGYALPSTPPREQLLDRYWSHTVKCQSCSVAYKGLNALEIVLQVVSIASIGIVAAAKQGMLSMAARTSLVSVAIICFLASRWLSHFVYKNFHFHDYDHAFR